MADSLTLLYVGTRGWLHTPLVQREEQYEDKIYVALEHDSARLCVNLPDGLRVEFRYSYVFRKRLFDRLLEGEITSHTSLRIINAGNVGTALLPFPEVTVIETDEEIGGEGPGATSSWEWKFHSEILQYLLEKARATGKLNTAI